MERVDSSIRERSCESESFEWIGLHRDEDFDSRNNLCIVG